MLHVPIRSRSANLLLAVVGAALAVSAPIVLAWYVVDAWGAATSTDRALQFILFLVAALGIVLIFIGLQNLAVARRGMTPVRRSTR
jgi:hypothetical protein